MTKKINLDSLESLFLNIKLEALKTNEQLNEEQSQVYFSVSDRDNPV